MAEFVLNKAQRLTFDTSSPNGILLFREVSKVLVAYGTRVLSVPSTADIYGCKYKGIWISLTILARGKRLSHDCVALFCFYGLHYKNSLVCYSYKLISMLEIGVIKI